MRSNRQLVTGLALILAGLVVVELGSIVASRDVFTGLVLLLVLPLAVSFCGAVLVFIGLARRPRSTSRARFMRRIVGLATVAGLGLALGFPALGTLGQLPDYASGLNGTFLSSSAAGIATFVIVGVGVLAGAGSGVLIALIWWVTRGRALPHATA
jgi:hypothetical protein